MAIEEPCGSLEVPYRCYVLPWAAGCFGRLDNVNKSPCSLKAGLKIFCPFLSFIMVTILNIFFACQGNFIVLLCHLKVQAGLTHDSEFNKWLEFSLS